ncbi:MAG: DNA double-strand break repair nuclease NurA [Crenarchaeota archaeon]|nr:DNA double-strand break repair nuclease NurA [Thermoproteota archaeon]
MTIDILEDLDSVLRSILQRLSERDEELRSLARSALSEGRALLIEGVSSYDPSAIVGVDGSRARIVTVGSSSVYLCRAVAVWLNGRRVDKARIVAVDAALDEDAEGCAEDAMIALETELYSECIGCRAIVIDGPIVDPPRPPKECFAHEAGLHEDRARSIKRAIESGALVVGVVKRLKGCLLGAPAHLAYYRLCRLVEDLARSRARIVAVPYLGPVAPSDVAEVYRGLGVEISSFVVLSSSRSSLYRVDVAPARYARRALELLASLPQSNDGLPLPVSLAHEASRIPRVVVETLRARAKRFLLEYASYLQ